MSTSARRKTAVSNPTYRLTEQDRWELSVLARMNLWTKTALAEAFGVTRKTVSVCAERYS